MPGRDGEAFQRQEGVKPLACFLILHPINKFKSLHSQSRYRPHYAQGSSSSSLSSSSSDSSSSGYSFGSSSCMSSRL